MSNNERTTTLQYGVTPEGPNDVYVLHVSVGQLAKREIAGPLATLLAMTDDIANLEQHQGKLVLAFDGYDDDPRPLYEVEEVVTWFQLLAAQWNAWLYFINVKDCPGQVALLMQLRSGRAALTGPALENELRYLADGLTAFGAHANIADERLTEILNAAFDSLFE
jgi:hypothetical protein